MLLKTLCRKSVLEATRKLWPVDLSQDDAYLHKPKIAKESVYYTGGGHSNAGGTVDLLLATVKERGRIASGETAREQGLCVSDGRAVVWEGVQCAWCKACPSFIVSIIKRWLSAAVQIRMYVTINFFFIALQSEALCTKSKAHSMTPRVLLSSAASGSTAIATRLLVVRCLRVLKCLCVGVFDQRIAAH